MPDAPDASTQAPANVGEAAAVGRAAAVGKAAAIRELRLHPLPVRIMHWINAVAMIMMILSGWGIYDDYIIVPGLHFAEYARLGSWAVPSLEWHFATMWLLAVNGIAYLTYGVATGRLRERLWPIHVRELIQTVRDTLHFKIEHADLTVYNAVQKLLYIVVIMAGMSQVVTGLLIWKPIQFSSAVAFLGGFQAVRVEHFVGMSVIVGFVTVHVALSLLVPEDTLGDVERRSPTAHPAGASVRSPFRPARLPGPRNPR